MGAEARRSDDGPGVRSVTRALALLSAVARGNKTLTELAGQAGVSLSTASRLLGTLRMTGYVSQADDGGYLPGPELTALIYSTDQWAGIRALAAEIVTSLRDEVGETCTFFVRAGHERVCIESAESPRLVRRVCPPGERGPVYLGAAGKALIAFSSAEDGPLGLSDGADSFRTGAGETRTLEDFRAECARIRKQGFAYSARETTDESWAVAVPMLRTGSLIGVLSVVVPLTRCDDSYVETLTQAAMACARRFGAE